MTCPFLADRISFKIHKEEDECETIQIKDEQIRINNENHIEHISPVSPVSSSNRDGVYKAAIFSDQISYNCYLKV